MDFVAKSGFDPNDVQVLAPMYKGHAGVASLNTQLKGRLNPVAARSETFGCWGPYDGKE